MSKALLAPIAFFYKMGVTFRHRLFDWGFLKSERFDIPIICIGNITVGGTGKTPMAEMIIAYMSQKHNIALLSRGYGRKTKGYREVSLSSHYREVGDEPLQIKLKFPDTVVVVCEKRSEAIRRIRSEHPEVDLIVMDDGFQHRYVEPKINVLMIDATRPIQHDRMLPVGSLRDLPSQIYRAHYFIVTKCPEKMAPIDRRILRKVLIQIAYQQVYYTRFESFIPQPLSPTRLRASLWRRVARLLLCRVSATPSRSSRRSTSVIRSLPRSRLTTTMSIVSATSGCSRRCSPSIPAPSSSPPRKTPSSWSTGPRFRPRCVALFITSLSIFHS